MNDGYLSKLISEYGDLKDRVEELEKKLEEYSSYMVKVRRIQQDNTKQIAELKKKLNPDRIIAIDEAITSHNERINELKEGLHWNLIYLQKEINELREEQRAFIEVCQEPCKDCKLNELELEFADMKQAHDTWWNDLALIIGEEHPKLKEVLRELIAVYEQETLIDTGLLEKLDVGSVRQTDKRKCSECEDSIIKRSFFDGLLFELKRGEK